MTQDRTGLSLRLLGPIHIETDGKAVEPKRQKAIALLVYLAMTGVRQPRQQLAAWFWPDSPPDRARGSLRRDLSILNQTVGGNYLNIERDTVGVEMETLQLDVAEFRRHLAACRQHGHPADAVCMACLQPLAQAVACYRGDFLTGFSLADCPEFDEWQFFQTEELRREYLTALERLIEGYATQGEPATALPFARRWVAADPLHEPAHRQLMRLYDRTGQRAAALRQYDLCAEALRQELGVDPAPETAELLAAIRRAPPSSTPLRVETGGTAADKTQVRMHVHNLASAATPLVGRVEGLALIAAKLQDPACRLLTLVGPGGVGKTRLAMQTAQNLAADATWHARFPDGIYYFDLSAVESPSHLFGALVKGLNLSVYRTAKPQQQLFTYVREKALLLVLDNFEHLLSVPDPETAIPNGQRDSDLGQDGAMLLAELLAGAPSLKALVTSRTALNLQEEWVYPVEGLRYPTGEGGYSTDVELAGYSAVTLFVQRAQQVRPDFAVAAQLEAVLRVCRLVEGLPLALELAATWVRLLTVEEITDEIERNLDFLTTSMRNVPVRHRSIRAVFEHSWSLLDDSAQDALRRLAVFRGGFRQGAAQAVADANLVTLARLVEQSLLRTGQGGRYRMHELLRQFAEAKLAETPALQTESEARHSAYFVRFLVEREMPLRNRQQRTALTEIEQDFENVRLACRRLLEKGDADGIGQIADSLYAFYRITSRFGQGDAFFRRALAQLPADKLTPSILTKLTARRGAFATALGMYGLARELLQKSLSMARQQEDRGEMAFSLDLLGNIVDIQGEREEAARLYQESLILNRTIGDRVGMAGSLYNLGWVAVGQGRYPAARARFQECRQLYTEVDNEAGLAHALDSLGSTAFFLGEYDEASQHFAESLALSRNLGDRHGVARGLGGLGLVAWGWGGPHLDEARRLLLESLAINRATGHQLEVARRLAFLGAVANGQGDFAAAETFLLEALTLAQEIGSTFGVAWAHAGLGTAALGQADPTTARGRLLTALDVALEAHHLPVVLDTLVAMAELLSLTATSDLNGGVNVGSGPSMTLQLAWQCCRVTGNHPGAWQISRTRGAQCLAALATQLDAETLGLLNDQVSVPTLEDLVIALTTEPSALFAETTSSG